MQARPADVVNKRKEVDALITLMADYATAARPWRSARRARAQPAAARSPGRFWFAICFPFELSTDPAQPGPIALKKGPHSSIPTWWN